VQHAGSQVTVLAISDVVEQRIYDARLRARFGHADLVVSCGDLPDYYLDYVVSTLNVPLLKVHGNHDQRSEPEPCEPNPTWGTTDLHARSVSSHGLLLAGLEGCRRYNDGPYQYTEAQMRAQVARLVPHLLRNKLQYGRYLDVLVTHAPPAGIHDEPDVCHRGFDVYRWLLRTFRPRYHLHGHIHVYDNRTVTRSVFEDTTVINVYGYRELQLELPTPLGRPATAAHG
jgi:Icc-related predicted phosphoesterase